MSLLLDICVDIPDDLPLKHANYKLQNDHQKASPEIQNRGTSGPKIGHVNVSDKKKNNNQNKILKPFFLYIYRNNHNLRKIFIEIFHY